MNHYFSSRVLELAGSVPVQRAVLGARPSETDVVRTDACTYVTAILSPYAFIAVLKSIDELE